MAVNETVAIVLDQGFAERAELIRQTGIRGNASAAFVQEQAQMGFLNSSQLVGALAATRLEKDGTANAILQQRAAAGQPGQA
jgi:hypothetical protein